MKESNALYFVALFFALALSIEPVYHYVTDKKQVKKPVPCRFMEWGFMCEPCDLRATMYSADCRDSGYVKAIATKPVFDHAAKARFNRLPNVVKVLSGETEDFRAISVVWRGSSDGIEGVMDSILYGL